MRNYKRKKLVHVNRQYELPFMMWDGWKIGPTGLVSPVEKIYRPDTLQLLEWKAAFYDRGKMNISNFYPDYPGLDQRIS